MYRPRDLNLVLTIRELLYRNGYTIAGARRKLLDARRHGLLENGCLTEPEAPSETAATSEEGDAPTTDERQLTLNDGARNDVLQEVREELRSLLRILDAS